MIVSRQTVCASWTRWPNRTRPAAARHSSTVAYVATSTVVSGHSKRVCAEAPGAPSTSASPAAAAAAARLCLPM